MITGYTAEGIALIIISTLENYLLLVVTRMFALATSVVRKGEASFVSEEVCPECEEYFETMQEAEPLLERLTKLLNNRGQIQLHDCLGWIHQELQLWEE